VSALDAAARPFAPAAWVVFTDAPEMLLLRWMAPGFRHCFVLLNDGRHWIAVDPLAACTEVEVLPLPADADVPGWYRERGHAVVRAALRRGLRRPAPFGPFTCVEAVKRVLGLHAPWVLTPRQLHRRLVADAA